MLNLEKLLCQRIKDTELIPDYQIMKNIPKSKSVNDYEEYINILNNHGLKDARTSLENMFILDYLIIKKIDT